MPRLSGFIALLADFLATADRVERARANARARGADAVASLHRARDTRSFTKALSSVATSLGDMAKATSAAVVRANDDRRARARERLAKINAQATALAASGQISGEEGAKLDFAIANLALRNG
jgi:hypothetical protein